MSASYLQLLFFSFSFCFCFCFTCFCSAEGACPSASFSPRIVPSKDDALLKVLVPNIYSTSLRQLVDCSDPSHVRGFCIDVFETALSILPNNLSSANISYTCFNFSDQTLTYNNMISAVANGSYDVVVGDVTIAAQRAYKIDFTYQFLKSGVVIITKTTNDDTMSNWFFFGLPFTWRMWLMVVGAFTSTGFILWLLEHENNHELSEGCFTQRSNKVFWFIMEALILLQRDSIKSTIGQFVMVSWVFVVLLFTSSYTASLSSILTANNLATTNTNILTVRDSNKSIGYRKGSITADVLMERFHIKRNNLKPIRASVDFINNITKGPSSGGVIAIVDELPYANLLLRNLSCDYAITGPQLTSEGFGFGFRHGLQDWVKEFSIALLNLTENGCLQELENKQSLSATNRCSSTTSQSIKISWKSLLPLFFIFFLIVSLCVTISYIRKKKAHNATHILGDDQLVSTQGPTDAEVEISTYFRHL